MGEVPIEMILKMKKSSEGEKKQLLFEDGSVFPIPDGALLFSKYSFQEDNRKISRDEYLITRESFEKYDKWLQENGFEKDRMSENYFITTIIIL